MHGVSFPGTCGTVIHTSFMSDHAAVTEAEQQLVFDLMRDRLIQLFGAGGNFRVSLGSATSDDAVFVATLADTIALDIATRMSPVRETAGRRAAVSEQDEHAAIWKHVEEQFDMASTGPEAFLADLGSGRMPVMVLEQDLEDTRDMRRPISA